jgi:molybdopterin synthase catalytic subunit
VPAWRPTIRVQGQTFDPGAEASLLVAGRTDIGATVAFIGYCRDEDGSLAALELEHYPDMAEAEISRIAHEALQRWQLLGLTIIHRFGRLLPGDPIVFVLTGSAHRDAAFQAASFLMDYLKTRAPFWKKEHLVDGTASDWVAAKTQDQAAAAHWTRDLPPKRATA